MNKKNFLILCAVMVVYIFASDFLIHGVLLKSTYMATANLWRSEADMQGLMPIMMLGQLLVGVFFSWIFVHGYKGKGWQEGARYGIFLAGYGMGQTMIMHVVAPYPTSLTVSWIVLGFIQAMLGGVLASVVYKK